MKDETSWIGRHEMKLSPNGEAFMTGFYTTRAQNALELILECIEANHFNSGGYGDRCKFVRRALDGECYLCPNLWDNETYCINGIYRVVSLFKDRFCTYSAEEALKECVDKDAATKLHKQRYEDAMLIANELHKTKHSENFKRLVGMRANLIQQEALCVLFDRQNDIVFEINEAYDMKKREELEREWIKLDRQIETILKKGENA